MVEQTTSVPVPRGTVGILDDAPARVAAMRAVMDDHPSVAVVDHLDAADFLAWLESATDVLFVSLDHDLGPSRVVDGDYRDPGIGMDVVQRMIELPPRFPVIVHSSNPIDAPRMEFLLADAGWEVHRVTPYEAEAWIPAAWAALVGQLLATDLVPTTLRTGGAQAVAGPAALAAALERLATLHAAGSLSDDEFREAKAVAIQLAAAGEAP